MRHTATPQAKGVTMANKGTWYDVKVVLRHNEDGTPDHDVVQVHYRGGSDTAAGRTWAANQALGECRPEAPEVEVLSVSVSD